MPSPSRAAGASIVLAALVSVSGCATKGDVRDLSQEIRALSLRQDSILAELRTQSASTRDTLRNTSRELFDIRGEVMRSLRAIQDELSRLSELTGQNQRTIAFIRDQMDAWRRTGPARSADLGGGGLGDGGGEADAMYNAAMEQYNRNLMVAARTGFNDFLATYPNDQLAPRAHYFLADILERENRVREAIDQFLRIPELFPTDEKVPDALYRVGVIHLDLGETDEARTFFRRVVNSYPDSPITPMAEERLREIGGGLDR